ncbi:MAG: hypothetical protein AB7O66_15650 [Limisphaerales bacterium]
MNPLPRARPPLFFLIIFALFGCAGIAILISLWARHDTFGGPPLIFRIMGSLIALMFITMGFGMPLTLLRGARGGDPSKSSAAAAPGSESTEEPSPASRAAGYTCPNCGAKLGSDQEVSPSGDTKCVYCKRWWNIHRTPA